MQLTALFTLPPTADLDAARSATDWRTLFVQSSTGTFQDWNSIRVVAVRDLLWLIAGNPAATTWLRANLDSVAGVIADTTGQSIPLEVRERQIGVRSDRERLWAYRIPRFVADKNARDWTPQMQPSLADDDREKLARSIEAGLRRELSAWDRLPIELDNNQPFIAISSPGRAVPVRAISSERSGHGKGVSVLVRSHLVFLSYWRFQGDLSVGPLASLGFGRLLLSSPPELLSPALQRSLIKIQPDLQDVI